MTWFPAEGGMVTHQIVDEQAGTLISHNLSMVSKELWVRSVKSSGFGPRAVRGSAVLESIQLTWRLVSRKQHRQAQFVPQKSTCACKPQALAWLRTEGLLASPYFSGEFR
jgi:hypothetical protein